MQEDEYYSKFLKRDIEKEENVIPSTITLIAQNFDEQILELTNITKEQISSISENLNQIASKINFNQTIELKTPEEQVEKFEALLQTIRMLYVSM